MLQELIDMVYFFSFSFIENSPNDEVDNCELKYELEIEDPVEGELFSAGGSGGSPAYPG